MLVKLAWRNLWRNKRRTLITAASVFFAVFLATSLRSLQKGVTTQMIENVVSFYSGYVQIHKDGYWDDQILDNSFEQTPVIQTAANETKGVQSIAPRLESFALASSGELSVGALVVGIDPVTENQLTGLKGKLSEGTYLEAGSTGVLMTEGLAEKLELSLGDTLILIGQGYHGISAAGKYAIEGIIGFGNPDLNQRLVYMALPNAQNLYGAENRLTSFALNITKPALATPVARSLEQGLEGDYEVMDWKEMMPEMEQLLEIDKSKGAMVMIILYVIIAFGMFGTVLMMTSERRHEFGVMMAIGMKKRILAAIVVLETIFISILGIIAGFLFSVPVIALLQAYPFRMTGDAAKAYEEFGIDPIIHMSSDPDIFISQIIAVLFFALLVSLYPALKIARTKPIEAMRD